MEGKTERRDRMELAEAMAKPLAVAGRQAGRQEKKKHHCHLVDAADNQIVEINTALVGSTRSFRLHR